MLRDALRFFYPPPCERPAAFMRRYVPLLKLGLGRFPTAERPRLVPLIPNIAIESASKEAHEQFMPFAWLRSAFGAICHWPGLERT